MPNPKRKHSKSRGASRAHSHRVAPPTLIPCQDCGALKEPHHVCPACGRYRGATILKNQEKKTKKSP